MPPAHTPPTPRLPLSLRLQGCGFLEFASAGAAAAAVEKNGEDLMERPMKVTPAETKPARGAGGAGGAAFGGAEHNPGEPNSEVYVGNLSYDVDDDSIKSALADCGTITNIRWITDRESGEFKGAGFIQFGSLEESAKAVAMHGTDVLGRPIRVAYAKGKPERAGGNDRGGAGGKKFENKLSEKPEGCTKVFCGNLSYEIDDDSMKKFFGDCGDVVAIRWLTDRCAQPSAAGWPAARSRAQPHSRAGTMRAGADAVATHPPSPWHARAPPLLRRNTGDFKGVGFVDFGTEAAVDKAIKKAGERLLGRPIRIDYAS